MLLTVENIGKTFNLNKATPKKVLSDVSFTLDNKEILVLLGTNGAGKTTTLKASVGILSFDAGEIKIDGISIKENPMAALWPVNSKKGEPLPKCFGWRGFLQNGGGGRWEP